MSRFTNLRILVVEDEPLIALEIEDVLLQLGYEVVGPVARLAQALELARSTALDGALLDVTVKDGFIYPVAVELQKQNVPIVFSTGYAPETLPPTFRTLPWLRKPFSTKQLEAVILATFVPRRIGPNTPIENRDN